MSWSFTEPTRPGVYWLRDMSGLFVARKTPDMGWLTVNRLGSVYRSKVIMYGPRILMPRPPTPKQQGEMMRKYMKATGWKPEKLTKKGKRNA